MNKQIIKMAKDLCHERDCHIKDEPTECYHGCKAWVYAERAVNNGYRKATDVASEIMREVRQALLNMVLANSMGETYDIEKRFAEIEKKYETEGAE